ncbi:hypothetical protein BDR07DRAFT_1401156 [Suillus spraguei]|nr:hypothetical protein BDR07DRAFT_1401156 [Suillus spraguei]
MWTCSLTEVLDNWHGVCYTSANPSSSPPCTNSDMMSLSNLRGSTITYPNHRFAIPHPITMSKSWCLAEPAALSYPPIIKYAHHNSTQEQYLTQSVSTLKPLSIHGSWHSPPTLHNCASTIGNNYWHLHTSQMYVLPVASVAEFCYSSPRLSEWASPTDDTFALGCGSLQMRLFSQARAGHGRNIYYPSDHTPIANLPYSTPPRSHSSPLPFSCRWLCDDDTPCEFTGILDELKAHCKTSHFAGPPDGQIECRWEACTYHKRDDRTVRVMRRDCMWRHTCEVHLGMRRAT